MNSSAFRSGQRPQGMKQSSSTATPFSSRTDRSAPGLGAPARAGMLRNAYVRFVFSTDTTQAKGLLTFTPTHRKRGGPDRSDPRSMAPFLDPTNPQETKQSPTNLDEIEAPDS